MPVPGNVGERVRNLRLTRRLSQAQLAGHDLSDSYISLIESGKRTPTPAVLRLLAERLGCTPEFLSDGIEPQQRAHLEVRERHAELALLGGDTTTALAEFDEVVERSDDPGLSLRAEWGRARALESVGRLEEAIRGFESLREQAERDSGRSSWIPPVIELARCYRAVGDLGQAISLGERAMEHLHRLGLTVGQENTELGRVLLLAYVDRSEPERAHELGRRILSGEEPSGSQIAEAYRHASSLALAEGFVGDALFLANRAISVLGEDERLHARAQLRVAAARALLRGVPPFLDGARPGVAGTTDPHGHGGTVGRPGTGTGTADGAGALRPTGTAAHDPDGASGAAEALALLQAAAPHLSGTEAMACALETVRALIMVGAFDDAVRAAERIIHSTQADMPAEAGETDTTVGLHNTGLDGGALDRGTLDGHALDGAGLDRAALDGAGRGGPIDRQAVSSAPPAASESPAAAGTRPITNSGLEVVKAWLLVARARLGQGDLAEARNVLESAATQLDRFFPSRAMAQVFRELGELCEAAGDIRAATTAYRRALEATGLRPTARPTHSAHDLADR